MRIFNITEIVKDYPNITIGWYICLRTIMARMLTMYTYYRIYSIDIQTIIHTAKHMPHTQNYTAYPVHHAQVAYLIVRKM